jgi:hypothetical protein
MLCQIILVVVYVSQWVARESVTALQGAAVVRTSLYLLANSLKRPSWECLYLRSESDIYGVGQAAVHATRP